MSAERPSPFELWQQANGDREEYRRLFVKGELEVLAKSYRQESIAWAEASTEFISAGQ